MEVNPHDGASKAFGVFIRNTLPSPIGIDIIGTIVKLGSDVTKFKVGDQIVGFGDPFNPDTTGTQEYSIIPTRQASLIPANVSPDEAATFPLNAMTMVFALFHETGLGLRAPFGSTEGNSDYSSESILIIGGGAATGKFGIQLAREAKFGKIIVVASKSSEPLLKSLGATTVIDRNQTEEKIEEEIRQTVEDDLIYAVDCVGRGADGQTLGARALSNTKKGSISTLVAAGGIDEARIGAKAAGYLRKPILCLTGKYPDITKSFWDVLPRWIEEGRLKPTTFQVVSGLDPVKIDGVLDSYIKGQGGLKSHIHIAE